MRYSYELKTHVADLRRHGFSRAEIGRICCLSEPTVCIWLNPDCVDEHRAAKRRHALLYNKSAAGKESQRRFKQSPKGRELQRRIESTPQYRAKKAVREKLPQNAAKRAARKRKRYTSDIGFRIAETLRSRLANAVSGRRKGASSVRDLGCTIPELLTRFAFFWPQYSIADYGEAWEIDHIRPLASFDLTDSEQAKIACNFANLQPLSVSDNRRKGAKWAG